jgi:hypothetical protein
VRYLENPQQSKLFDIYRDILSPVACNRLQQSWEQLFRLAILGLLPAGKLAQHFHPARAQRLCRRPSGIEVSLSVSERIVSNDDTPFAAGSSVYKKLGAHGFRSTIPKRSTKSFVTAESRKNKCHANDIERQFASNCRRQKQSPRASRSPWSWLPQQFPETWPGRGF